MPQDDIREWAFDLLYDLTKFTPFYPNVLRNVLDAVYLQGRVDALLSPQKGEPK